MDGINSRFLAALGMTRVPGVHLKRLIIEPWLESPNEFIRLQAATTILKLDPDRKEFLPIIWEATGSDNLTIQRFAREFFDESADLEE